MKIVPGYDVAQHIIEGATMDPNGTGLVPQPDPVDLHDPLDFPVPGNGNIDGQRTEAIQASSRAETVGLQSDRADLGQQMVDMDVASSGYDEPTKGGISYGPRG